MATKVFIKLSVKNPDKFLAFFQNLGFSFNPRFTDERAGCIFEVRITDTYFKFFIDTEVCDAHHSTEVLFAVDAESAADVKQFRGKAESLGGSIDPPAKDLGFMFQHSCADLEGHKWEMAYADKNQFRQS